jgi:AcrR family transcriptional regulator
MAYRPTEKTEARKKAQRKLLIDTSLQIVSKEGFRSLTIASLAEQADVATGTVYKYFASKADLCAEVFRVATEKEVRQVRLAAFPYEESELTGDVHQLDGCRERLASALEIFSRRALEGRSLAYALIAEPVDSMVQQERLKYRNAYADIFEQLVREGVDKEEFSVQNAKVSAAAMVGALAETLLGSIASAEQKPQDFDSEEWLREILDFCLAGVCR